MEKKLVGRKLLRVLLFCFISISVFGISENALRNDLPLLLSNFDKLSYPKNFGFDKLSHRPSFDMSGFDKLSYQSSFHTPGFDLSINSRQSKFSHRYIALFEQGNGLTPEVIAHDCISRKSFLLNFAFSGTVQLQSQTFTSLISLPFTWLALGYFILDLNTSITQSV